MLTREEAHALLDAAIDVNTSKSRYEIECDFMSNFDGTPMVNIFVRDTKLDDIMLRVLGKTNLIKSFIVSDYSESVWDAIKEIAKYKVGGDSK